MISFPILCANAASQQHHVLECSIVDGVNTCKPCVVRHTCTSFSKQVMFTELGRWFAKIIHKQAAVLGLQGWVRVKRHTVPHSCRTLLSYGTGPVLGSTERNDLKVSQVVPVCATQKVAVTGPQETSARIWNCIPVCATRRL